MLEFQNQRFAEVVGPANTKFQRGSSSMKGSVMDRGTTNFSDLRRWPKGVRANTAGSFTLVDATDGTTPVVLSAGETLLWRWKAFTDSSVTAGSSTLDNFIIIWD